MKKYLLLSLAFSMWIVAMSLHAQQKNVVLSQLDATQSDAVYTTYAAAKDRSEFTLDEGYHFLFYDSSRGIDFITDTAGDLCLAFKQGADYVYELADFYKKPVISLNFPDMVKYNYAPFQNLEVEAVFLVENSYLAIHDVSLKNTGQEKLSFQMIPFLHNRYRVFNEVEFHPNKNAISFTHEELPDQWVLNHDIPYVNPVRDVFLLSRAPERLASYRSYRWGEVPIPQQVIIDKKPGYVVWGKISKPDGERYRPDEGDAEIMVTMDAFPNKILTSTAPRWGSADPNIKSYGFFGIELGNFGDLQEGDVYTLSILSRKTGQFASLTDTIRNLDQTRMIRKDLVLGDYALPPVPVDIDKDIWGSGTEIRLFWKYPVENFSFNVYRRDYRKSGVYDLVAESLDRNFFTDKNIQGDQIYGYVVTAVNPEGESSMPTPEINNIAGSDFLTDIRYPDQIVNDVREMSRVVAMPVKCELPAGETIKFRVIRAVSRMDKSTDELIQYASAYLKLDLQKYEQANETLFSKIPGLATEDADYQMLYWNAYSLMRQVMLPPEAKCGYNYYVFSREPTWGWGHGGQVFHESLTMLAYAYMDPRSAMDSQRIYVERQEDNGYINYRTGPYLDERIPYQDQLTTSAPWYAWQNWEIYKITGDRDFLSEMYNSSRLFYEYYTQNRDSDKDGLCEWGAHAVLESVRDARVAVWDEVAWPSHFEAIDLNSMLVMEAKSLAKMADELAKPRKAEQWREEADARAQKINDLMWDPETGFYYHLDKKDNDFTYGNPDDLKREEIIGFLPLWAGIADKTQAEKLITKLTDPGKFWRKYGVPSLAADDSYYNPKGYWNGPVWVEWDFLILHGLLQYGYDDLAEELVMRVAANMIAQLQKDHQFWEFYSPDHQWAGYHKQYIWAGIINRMLLDTYGTP